MWLSSLLTINDFSFRLDRDLSRQRGFFLLQRDGKNTVFICCANILGVHFAGKRQASLESPGSSFTAVIAYLLTGLLRLSFSLQHERIGFDLNLEIVGLHSRNLRSNNIRLVQIPHVEQRKEPSPSPQGIERRFASAAHRVEQIIHAPLKSLKFPPSGICAKSPSKHF